MLKNHYVKKHVNKSILSIIMVVFKKVIGVDAYTISKSKKIFEKYIYGSLKNLCISINKNN